MERKIRVLMSKPGTDGHWRGIVTISRGLRDAGMEVIFGGFQSVEEIVESAIQEDIDVIGLSIHSGAHVGYTRRLMEKLDQEGVRGDFMVLVGGAIPCDDFAALKELGVSAAFGPGTMIPEIVEFITKNVRLRHDARDREMLAGSAI
ncbi:MAG: cobalamin-dependent protein [bacterium]